MSDSLWTNDFVILFGEGSTKIDCCHELFSLKMCSGFKKSWKQPSEAKNALVMLPETPGRTHNMGTENNKAK